MAIAAHVQVHLRHPHGPVEQVVGVQEHRRLHGVPGREREAVEELAPGRHLPGERLREGGQLGIERRQQGPGGQLRDPAAVHGVLVAVGRGERPPEVALHEAQVALGHQRSQHPGDEMTREAARVGVEVDDQVAVRHGQGPPHRVALAECGTQLGDQLGLLVHLGAVASGQVGGAVLGGRVHHQHLVHQPVEAEHALHDRPDRVRHLAGGEHDGHALLLERAQLREREPGVMKGEDQVARTMAQ